MIGGSVALIAILALLAYAPHAPKQVGGVLVAVHEGELDAAGFAELLDRSGARPVDANLTRFFELVERSRYAAVVGPLDAKVLIIEFVDPFCPHCIAMIDRVGDVFVELVRNGTASMVLVYTPTATWGLTNRHAGYAKLSLSIWESWRSSGDPVAAMVRDMKRLAVGGLPEPPSVDAAEAAVLISELRDAARFAIEVSESLGFRVRGTPTTVVVWLG